MKWIRFDQRLPRRWARKMDVPKHLSHFAVRVDFPFQRAWIVRDENRRVLMGEVEWAETFDFHLNTPGHVIGLADMNTANAHEWKMEWRQAMHDRRVELLARVNGGEQ